ncbi:MAG: hypothetical protein Q4C01_03335 [Clostridia bacterium]|nr:hypothetical protein [Clostridia bacterium]
MGRFYMAFILAEDGKTMHSVTLRAEDMMLEFDAGNSSVSLNGSTITESYSAEYDTSATPINIGQSSLDYLEFGKDGAMGVLFYVYVYHPIGTVGGTETSVPLGTTDIEFKCYSNSSSEDDSDSVEATAAEPSEEPVEELTEMKRLYETVKDVSNLIDYDSEYDAVVLRLTEDEEKAAAAVNAINDALQGKPLRMMIKYQAGVGNNDIHIIYDALTGLNSSEISLIDFELWSNGGYKIIGDIQNLVSLTVPTGLGDADFSQCTELRKVTVRITKEGERLYFKWLESMPALESYTLDIAEGAYVYSVSSVRSLSNLQSLKTLSINGDFDGEGKLPVRLMCEVATTAPNIESICGKSDFDAEAGLTSEELVSYKYMRSEDFCRYEYDLFDGGGYSEGGSDPGGKTMVLVFGGGEEFYSSYDKEVMDDYYGIGPEKLTLDPSECTRIIVVYADYERVGMYTNGMPADKTHTTVVVLDPINRTVCSSKVVATVDPPDQISGYYGGNGEYLPLEAKDYVLSLLN